MTPSRVDELVLEADTSTPAPRGSREWTHTVVAPSSWTRVVWSLKVRPSAQGGPGWVLVEEK